MMNKGWECPKCGAVFSPTYMECKYCKPPKVTTSGYANIGCDHEWDASQIYTSNPPRLRCKKCNLHAPFFSSGQQVFL